MESTTSPLAVRQAAVLDLLRNGADVGTAAKAAGVAVRTVHDWATKHPEFAALKADAMLNRGRVVTEGQLAAWRTELADLRAGVDQIHADLINVAAPALAGDEAAKARQAELRELLRSTEEQIGALSLAVQSAEQHLARAREQESETAREAAQVEDDQLAKDQRAAAAEVDAALATLEQAVQKFTDAAIARQSAQRRATGRSRPVVADRQVMQALFHNAPRFAQLIGADRKLAAHARALGDLV